MATIISRSQLSHPDLGESGGAPLHTSIATIYTTLGDNDNSRIAEHSGIADSTTVELDHNFGARIQDFGILIYSGTGTTKTLILDYVDAGWVVAEKTGEESTVLEITTPSSGGPHTFTVFVIDGKRINKQSFQLLASVLGTASADSLDTWFDDNKRGLSIDDSGGIRPLSFFAPSYTSSNANAVVGQSSMVRSDVAAVQITAPATIANYDVWMVVDAGRNANGNNITVARNGNTINGLAEDYIIQDNGGWVIFIGDATNTDWIVLASGAGGGGSGQGFRNYFTNGSFESNVTDGVTVGGGTAPTISAEEVSPLFDVRSARATSGAGTGYVDFEITGIDNAVLDGGIMLGLTAYFRTDAASVDGDWTAGIYETSVGEYLGSIGQTDLDGDRQTTFRGTMVPESGKTYVLRVEFTDTTAAKFVDVDGLLLTPDSSTSLVDFMTGFDSEDTFTGLFGATGSLPSFGGIDKDYVKWKRIGNEMFAVFCFDNNSAGANGVGTYFLNIPAGLNIDLGILDEADPHMCVGQYVYTDAINGHLNKCDNIMAVNNSTSLHFRYMGTASDDSNIWDATNTPTFFNSNLRLAGWFRVPIAEWADSQINLITPNLLESTAQAKYQLTNTAYTSNTDMDFDTEDSNFDIKGSWANSNGVITIPATGTYDVTAYVRSLTDWVLVTRLALYVGGVDTEQFDVAGANARILRGTVTRHFTKGQTFSIRADGTTTLLSASYLVVKRRSPVGAHEAIGFGTATETNYGLVLDKIGPRKNYMINGGCRNWQRGTSVSGINRFHADRFWAYGNDLASSYLLDGFAPFSHGMRITPPSSNYGGLSYTMSTEETKELHGKYVTFSFDIRTQGTFDGTVTLHLGRNTSEAKSAQENTYGERDITSELTTSFQRISITTNQPVETTAASFIWSLSRNGHTAGASNIIDISNLKLEIGETATDFCYYGGSPNSDTDACYKYYYRNNPVLSGLTNTWAFIADNANNAYGGRSFPSEMRTTPTITLSDNSGANNSVHRAGVGDTGATVNINYLNTKGFTEINKTGGWATSNALLANVEADAEI